MRTTEASVRLRREYEYVRVLTSYVISRLDGMNGVYLSGVYAGRTH